MGRINVLDKHLAELIAAGEVVERPASAIKEMVENSIDAGASAIVVEIKNGGNTFMRVTDNGCGIERDDIKKAFLRHATSKIKTEDDLNAIGTLGFRGEALASISAVSKLEMITRTSDSDFGVKYVIHGGEEL
ncbi:MAG: DNA mismatch repair endonuclease MutL, partial [Acutalibacteraceae bacterium]